MYQCHLWPPWIERLSRDKFWNIDAFKLPLAVKDIGLYTVYLVLNTYQKLFQSPILIDLAYHKANRQMSYFVSVKNQINNIWKINLKTKLSAHFKWQEKTSYKCLKQFLPFSLFICMYILQLQCTFDFKWLFSCHFTVCSICMSFSMW